MAEFFVLINCDIDHDKIEKEITKLLPKEASINFHRVYGVYDLVLEIKNMSDSVELTEKIKSIENVSSIILTVAHKKR